MAKILIGQPLAIGVSSSGGSSSGPFIPETWDAPGATAFFLYVDTSNSAPHIAGEEVAGSVLTDGGVYKATSTGDIDLYSGHQHPSGSWRLQGMVGDGMTGNTVTAAIRIDSITQSKLAATQLSDIVRNLAYANADGTLIDCELFFQNGWHPFTASQNDCTWWGQDIFAAAVAGELGEVAAYVAPDVPDDDSSGDATS